VIWLTWRQFRAAAIVAALALAAVAIMLALTTHQQFLGLTHVHLLQFLSTALVGLPVLTGMFWGAPLLARELETGTYRLAWTQGVTRTRWLVVKVTMIGLASVAVNGLLSLLLTLWSSHVVNLGRFSQAMFDERGIAPMGDAAFAFALGLTAGILIRRTLPAMVTTLVGFFAGRLVVTNWVRPHFATPLKLIAAAGVPQNGTGFNGKPGDWVISNDTINAAGKVVQPAFQCNVTTLIHRGLGSPSGPGVAVANAANRACMAKSRAYTATLRQVLTYQPLSRYWTFQVYDVAVFLGVALLMIGFCLWWVRHRLT
jgi:hypothetical protein